MSVAIVLGSLAPYHHRLYEAYTAAHDGDLNVLTCATIEPHRNWSIPPPQHYKLHFMPGLRYHASMTSHVYFNPAVISTLARLKPEIIIIADFTPTMGLAALFARAAGIPYGITTDGHLGIDPGERSSLHRFMRRLLVPKASFGIGASEESIRLLERWGLDAGCCSEVPIVTVWDPPATPPARDQRPYDVLFVGTVDERVKGALFFADIMAAVKTRGFNPKVRVAGDGPLRNELSARLAGLGIESRFDGALQPRQMAEVYTSAKLLLFPSRGDAWGLVANEAVMCRTPVIGSPHAASSTLLLERFGVGIVRPLQVDAWADAVVDALSSPERWNGTSARWDEAIQSFSLQRSVAGLHRAIEMGRASGHVRSAQAGPNLSQSGPNLKRKP